MRCEDIAPNQDFRPLSTISGIAVDLRYSSVDNFIGRNLYGSLDCAWLHHLAAARLERAAQLLAREAPRHRLLVLDALRPHRV
jgi:D-alanyl-D-alanine dipeptidase